MNHLAEKASSQNEVRQNMQKEERHAKAREDWMNYSKTQFLFPTLLCGPTVLLLLGPMKYLCIQNLWINSYSSLFLLGFVVSNWKSKTFKLIYSSSKNAGIPLSGVNVTNSSLVPQKKILNYHLLLLLLLICVSLKH